MAENKQLFIPDSSVLLKWVINEKEDFAEAMNFRDDLIQGKIEVSIPTHCFIEAANFLGRAMKNAPGSYLSYLMNFDIPQHALTFTVATIAFDLIGTYPGITFYDASYHALALQEGGIFITADKKYYEKTHKEGSVMLLKDYGEKRYTKPRD